jgi:hypothetical protein
VAAEIAKAAIKGDQDPVLGAGPPLKRDIRDSLEVEVPSIYRVVPQAPKIGCYPW